MSDLDDKIEEIKVKIYELQKDLAVIMNDATKPKEWNPVGGDWFIGCDDSVHNYPSRNDYKVFERPTKEQAERSAVEMRKFNRLLALRDELCGDDVVDWSSSEAKYFLCHSEESKTWDVNVSFCINNNSVYFTTRQYAQFACDMLNSGEVKL